MKRETDLTDDKHCERRSILLTVDGAIATVGFSLKSGPESYHERKALLEVDRAVDLAVYRSCDHKQR